DIIARVNGLTVRNRPQARDLLSLVHQSEAPNATVAVRRGSQFIELSLDPRSFGYPYCTDTDRHLGIVFLGTGFRASHLERLREIIASRGAKHVLLLSSRLVRPTLEEGLREASLLPPDVHLEIEVPRNRFFGGNIFIGDLLVVQDFIDHIHDHLARAAQKPDLIAIPSSPFSLGPWQRDLTGRPYLDIERAVGIPVELIECSPILE
ncbi:MAG: hypothetical protein Q8O76_02300, partial [Chloroflexota bacterium]|nr:hypothetical protein [Chloroflexota bacterium]